MTVNHPPNHSTAPILLPVLGFRLVMSDRPSPVDDFRHQPRLHAPAFSTAEMGTPPRKPFSGTTLLVSKPDLHLYGVPASRGVKSPAPSFAAMSAKSAIILW